jgi:hypothetical protein
MYRSQVVLSLATRLWHRIAVFFCDDKIYLSARNCSYFWTEWSVLQTWWSFGVFPTQNLATYLFFFFVASRCCDVWLSWLWCTSDGSSFIDLSTAHCPLPTVHISLPTAICPLPPVYCALPTVRYPLSSAHCQLSTAHIPMSTVHIPLPTVHCPHSTVQCPHSTVHCPLSTGQLSMFETWPTNITLVPKFSRRIPSPIWAVRDVSVTVGINRHLNAGKEYLHWPRADHELTASWPSAYRELTEIAREQTARWQRAYRECRHTAIEVLHNRYESTKSHSYEGSGS